MLQVQAIGHVGRKPEMTFTPTGVAVTKFSLAVNPTDKRSDGQDNTIWFNCVAWRGLAETCNTYVDVGTKLFVQGTFRPRPYEGRDGKNYVSYDLTIDKFTFLSKSNKQEDTSNEPSASVELLEEEHPF